MANEIEVRDIGLVAYLNLQGVKHEELRIEEGRNRGDLVTVFVYGEHVRQMESDYDSGAARVDPYRYSKEIRYVKEEIASAKRKMMAGAR